MNYHLLKKEKTNSTKGANLRAPTLVHSFGQRQSLIEVVAQIRARLRGRQAKLDENSRLCGFRQRHTALLWLLLFRKIKWLNVYGDAKGLVARIARVGKEDQSRSASCRALAGDGTRQLGRSRTQFHRILHPVVLARVIGWSQHQKVARLGNQK